MNFQEWFHTQSGLTQKAFAKRVGVTQGRIWQLLNGYNPSFRLAHRIADASQGAVTLNDFGGSEKFEARPVAPEEAI